MADTRNADQKKLERKVAGLEAQLKIITKWARKTAQYLRKNPTGDPPPPRPPKDWG